PACVIRGYCYFYLIVALPSSTCGLLFFILRHRAHLALHSFPTRRSSDLTTVPITHATPAGFCVNSERRGDQAEIALMYHDLRFEDRKSTRLNSSHVKISYAVFCLKKKKAT